MSNTKITLSLKRIKVIIWDYDGVHYSYAIFPQEKAFEDIKTRAACLALPDLTPEEALLVGEEGYKKYGASVLGYAEWAACHGHDPVQFRERFFAGYHTDLFNRIACEFPNHIHEDKPTVAAFQRCASIIQHGVATHSSISYWAKPFLKQQNLLQFFDEKALIGLDDVDYALKHESVAALERIMTMLGVSPEEVMFVEDTLRNLAFARSKLPGLTTTFMHHGAPLASLPDYVTMQARNPKTLMQAIARTHGL